MCVPEGFLTFLLEVIYKLGMPGDMILTNTLLDALLCLALMSGTRAAACALSGENGNHSSLSNTASRPFLEPEQKARIASP